MPKETATLSLPLSRRRASRSSRRRCSRRPCLAPPCIVATRLRPRHNDLIYSSIFRLPSPCIARSPTLISVYNTPTPSPSIRRRGSLTATPLSPSHWPRPARGRRWTLPVRRPLCSLRSCRTSFSRRPSRPARRPLLMSPWMNTTRVFHRLVGFRTGAIHLSACRSATSGGSTGRRLRSCLWRPCQTTKT